MALMRVCVVPNCFQCLSWPILWIVTVCATYWTHTIAVCVLMVVLTCLRLPTFPRHPLICAISDITVAVKKLLTIQQHQLVNRNSYRTLYSYTVKSSMAIGQHNRTTAVSILQIGFSRNTECADMTGFPWLGHKFTTNSLPSKLFHHMVQGISCSYDSK